MQEVKRPKKPLIYFYVAMILAIVIFNCLVAPYLARKAIKDVDYGNFSLVDRIERKRTLFHV